MKGDGFCWFNGTTSELPTTFPEQYVPNLPRKNYWQWTDWPSRRFFVFGGSFFACISPIILILHYVKENYDKENIWGTFFIPQVEVWVMVKEDDKIICHERGVYINSTRINDMGIYNYSDVNMQQ